jgi:hypothetical protein
VNISNSEEGESNGGQQSDNDAGSHNSGEVSDGELSDTTGAVAIAAIEAERDVSIALIHAENEAARIEAQASSAEQIIEATTDHNEELEQCRNEIAELREKLDRLAEQLTPPPLSEVSEEIIPENSGIAPVNSLTDQFIVTPEASIKTVLSDVNEDVEETLARPIKRLIVI